MFLPPRLALGLDLALDFALDLALGGWLLSEAVSYSELECSLSSGVGGRAGFFFFLPSLFLGEKTSGRSSSSNSELECSLSSGVGGRAGFFLLLS